MSLAATYCAVAEPPVPFVVGSQNLSTVGNGKHFQWQVAITVCFCHFVSLMSETCEEFEVCGCRRLGVFQNHMLKTFCEGHIMS